MRFLVTVIQTVDDLHPTPPSPHPSSVCKFARLCLSVCHLCLSLWLLFLHTRILSFNLKTSVCPFPCVCLSLAVQILILNFVVVVHIYTCLSGVRRKARSLLTRAATDPVWYGCLFSSHGKLRAKYNLTEPVPLQVEQVVVEFIVEPFRPSGPFL